MPLFHFAFFLVVTDTDSIVGVVQLEFGRGVLYARSCRSFSKNLLSILGFRLIAVSDNGANTNCFKA